MKFNPTNLDFRAIRQKGLSVTPSESHRKAVPGFNLKFQEENFIEFTVQSSNGPLKLQTYRENPEKSPKGLVFLVIGLFSHQNRMAHIAKSFAKEGYTTVGFDFRGHGKSQGLPGYIDNYNTLINDFILFTKLVDKLYDEKLPRFSIGQSMGGMVILLAGNKMSNYFKGMIFLAPCFKMHDKLKYPVMGARFLSYIIPRVALPTTRTNDASKNPAVFEDSMADTLVYRGGMRPRTVRSISDGTNEIEHRAIQNFTLPYLMFMGDSDSVVDTAINFQFAEKCKSKDKTSVLVEDCLHDLAHEQEIFKMLEVCVEWMNKRLDS